MSKSILAIGKIRHCGRCHKTQIFCKETSGRYHCQTCGLLLVESSQAKREKA